MQNNWNNQNQQQQFNPNQQQQFNPNQQQQQFNPNQQQQQFNPNQQQQYFDPNQQYNQQQQQQFNPYNQQQNFQQQQFNPYQQQQQYFDPNQQYNQQQQNFQQQNQYQQQNVQQNQNQQQRSVFVLKEKWFSIGTSIAILDENGKNAYYGVGKLIHIGLDMYLEDLNGQKLYQITHKLISLMPEYEIWQGNTHVGKVRKEITLFRPAFHFNNLVTGDKMEVHGDFHAYEFKIEQNGQLVATISKKHTTFKDAYGVMIEPGFDIPFILCACIIVEKYEHDHEHKLF